MIIRVRSPIGTKQLELSDKDHYKKLTDLVCEAFNLSFDRSVFLSTSHAKSDILNLKPRSIVSKCGLKHGDLLYLINDIQESNSDTSSNSYQSNPSGASQIGRNDESVFTNCVEDKIDQELGKTDGRIHRKMNDQLCHHSVSGKCIHCVPLEPFDSAYLEHLDPPVKFMSFHAYLRKLSGGQSKGKFTFLENLSCRIRPGCHEHPPWPDGICTKCQPNPVTLEIQPYRHVDFVQFENAQLMDQFLDYWRQTGCQRIGIMFGRYERFAVSNAPPLAIKAIVAAIYEPAQESKLKSIKLSQPIDQILPKHVVDVAQRIGLRPVGWIFTDLVAQDRSANGVVKHYRGTVDTFFLSAEECITAASLQNLYPNICRLSTDGCFGSKFVTVVVTGDADNHIHFEAYQVSNQAMALVRDRILIPTYDAPELGYIRETTKEQFVPEVFYSTTDKYNNRVTRVARPLPVEYLLVDMAAAFPIEPVYTMAKLPDDFPSNYRFPIENRESIGHVQDVSTFARLLEYFGPNRLYTCLTNFHVLIWLAQSDALVMNLYGEDGQIRESSEGIVGLLEAINVDTHSSDQPRVAVAKWAQDSTVWANVQLLAKTIATSNVSTTSQQLTSGSDQRNVPTNADSSGVWSCPHCTFHNNSDVDECEMCRLPRS